MRDSFGLKLIAVINSVEMVLYEAKGIKVIKRLKDFPIVFEKHRHHKKEKTESHYQKKSTPGSLFEPYSAPKDIEYREAAKKVSEIMEKKINDNLDYKKLIIVADPKMLGHIRQSVSKNLKNIIYKEIPKNLMGQDIYTIEQSVFE